MQFATGWNGSRGGGDGGSRQKSRLDIYFVILPGNVGFPFLLPGKTVGVRDSSRILSGTGPFTLVRPGTQSAGIRQKCGARGRLSPRRGDRPVICQGYPVFHLRARRGIPEDRFRLFPGRAFVFPRGTFFSRTSLLVHEYFAAGVPFFSRCLPTSRPTSGLIFSIFRADPDSLGIHPSDRPVFLKKDRQGGVIP